MIMDSYNYKKLEKYKYFLELFHERLVDCSWELYLDLL